MPGFQPGAINKTRVCVGEHPPLSDGATNGRPRIMLRSASLSEAAEVGALGPDIAAISLAACAGQSVVAAEVLQRLAVNHQARGRAELVSRMARAYVCSLRWRAAL